MLHQDRHLSLLESGVQQFQSHAQLEGVVGSVGIVDSGMPGPFGLRQRHPKLGQFFDLGAECRRDHFVTQRKGAPNRMEYLSALKNFWHVRPESTSRTQYGPQSEGSRPNPVLK